MAIPNPKFNYISSTKKDFRDSGEMFKVDVKNGQQPVVSPVVYASGSTLGHIQTQAVIEKNDFHLGASKPTVSVPKTKEDVVLAPASGMTVVGVLTYGSGKITNTTVWPTDNDFVKQGNFQFARPNGPVEYTYGNLAT